MLYKNVDNQSSINFGLSTFFYYLFDIIIFYILWVKEEQNLLKWDQTLLTFKHNFRAILNGARFNYSNGYSNYINLLTRIILEENKIKEKEPSNLYIA